jgi:hypothetical protein
MTKVWLNVPYHRENVSGEYHVVYSRAQAAEMTHANAHQLMRAAQSVFSDFIWDVVPVARQFIVEGTKKETE